MVVTRRGAPKPSLDIVSVLLRKIVDRLVSAEVVEFEVEVERRGTAAASVRWAVTEL